MLDYARTVTEANDGLAAINKFIGTRFELADEYEAQGKGKQAATIRETWTGVLTDLDMTLGRALAAEMLDLPPVDEPALA